MKFEYLTKPLKVGHKVLKNRMVMPPMETRLSRQDGSATREMVAYYAERARGGVGMIIVENTFVDNKASRSSLVSSGLYNDHMIASKYDLSEAIKLNGAVAIIQLSHGGRQANGGATGLQCVGPSAIPSRAVGRMPHALLKDEILEIEDAFAAAAVRAKSAGFDGVEIHGAHGYLISSFLSPDSNKRTDEYGGSEENRGRFARETISKVRDAVGRDFIVGLRINGSDFLEEGLTTEQSCNFVRTVEDKIDYVHVSASFYESNTMQISPLYIPQAPIVDLAAEMKKAVSIPVIAVNSINAEIGEQALKDGKADLISFGRSLIADPELPKKVIAGKPEDIRPCCRGNEGCISLFFSGCPIRCEVNGRCGHELEYTKEKTRDPKNVVVVGGGMAGMEAARVACERGHKVTLFEKTGTLGGHFSEGTVPSFKHEGKRLLELLIRQIKDSGIDIRMNTEADAEVVSALLPDAVIVAVGSKYSVPPISGADGVMLPDEALTATGRVGKKAVVIGGGLIGSETALHLAEAGRDVTIIEMLPDIAMADEGISQAAVRDLADKMGVKKLVDTTVTKIDGNTVYAKKGDDEITVEADTVICAVGLEAKSECASEYCGCAEKVYVIGDCVAGRKVFDCTAEAWHAVYDLDK